MIKNIEENGDMFQYVFTKPDEDFNLKDLLNLLL